MLCVESLRASIAYLSGTFQGVLTTLVEVATLADAEPHGSTYGDRPLTIETERSLESVTCNTATGTTPQPTGTPEANPTEVESTCTVLHDHHHGPGIAAPGPQEPSSGRLSHQNARSTPEGALASNECPGVTPSTIPHHRS